MSKGFSWIDAAETAALDLVPDHGATRALTLLSDAAAGGRVWIATAAALAVTGERGRRAGSAGLAALGASGIAVAGIKRVVRRRRPHTLRSGHGRSPRTSSMPSSHAASAAAFVTAAAVEWPEAGLVLAPVCVAVSASRLTSRRHFPSDVAAGLLLGSAVGGSVALGARSVSAGRPGHGQARDS